MSFVRGRYTKSVKRESVKCVLITFTFRWFWRCVYKFCRNKHYRVWTTIGFIGSCPFLFNTIIYRYITLWWVVVFTNLMAMYDVVPLYSFSTKLTFYGTGGGGFMYDILRKTYFWGVFRLSRYHCLSSLTLFPLLLSSSNLSLCFFENLTIYTSNITNVTVKVSTIVVQFE